MHLDLVNECGAIAVRAWYVANYDTNILVKGNILIIYPDYIFEIRVWFIGNTVEKLPLMKKLTCWRDIDPVSVSEIRRHILSTCGPDYQITLRDPHIDND